MRDFGLSEMWPLTVVRFVWGIPLAFAENQLETTPQPPNHHTKLPAREAEVGRLCLLGQWLEAETWNQTTGHPAASFLGPRRVFFSAFCLSAHMAKVRIGRCTEPHTAPMQPDVPASRGDHGLNLVRRAKMGGVSGSTPPFWYGFERNLNGKSREF